MAGTITLAIDDLTRRARLTRELSDFGVVVSHAEPVGPWWDRLREAGSELVVAAYGLMPAPADEAAALFCSSPTAPGLAVIGDASEDERARLHAAGCLAVLPRRAPKLAEALCRVLDARLELLKQRERDRERQADTARLSDFVSQSPVMLDFMKTVERVVPSDVSLLVLGETGVGKERLARAIHQASPRSGGPFIAVNCGALPETLLESELFGHVEGAFTGARARRGCFEMADGGTLFLDEIGELPHHLQVRLLRVLQDSRVRRLGSERAISVDLRVMAATNRKLDTDDKPFRSDLYYRLTVMTLVLPPLRDRREDIPELARRLVEILRPRAGRPIVGISDEAITALARYGWPGNVRELRNVIERAMLLCAGVRVELSDLPAVIAAPSHVVRQSGERAGPPVGAGTGAAAVAAGGAGVAAGGAAAHGVAMAGSADAVGWDAGEWLGPPPGEGATLGDVRRHAVATAEARYLAALLERTRGRVGETAELAGVTPRALYTKMRRYGLRKERFRAAAARAAAPAAGGTTGTEAAPRLEHSAGAAADVASAMPPAGPRRLLRHGVPTASSFTVSAAPCRAKLDQNEAPWPLPEQVRRELFDDLAGRSLERYPQPADYVATKARFCDALGLDADRVVLTAGADQLIAYLFLAAGGAGRSARIIEPTYPMYALAATMSETRADVVTLDADYQVLPEHVAVDAEIVALVSPNNPTGNAISREVVLAALERPGLVIVDEAYADFAEHNVLDLTARHDNLFVVRSMSKSLLAGARLGYGVGHPQLIAALEALLAAPYHLSHLQMTLADRMAQLRPLSLERAQRVRERCDPLRHELGARGFDATSTQTNFLCARVPEGVQPAALYEALARAGVRVRDVSAMPSLSRHLRFTIGTDDEHELLLAAIDDYLASRSDAPAPGGGSSR